MSQSKRSYNSRPMPVRPVAIDLATRTGAIAESAGTRVRLAAATLARALESYVVELLAAHTSGASASEWIDQDQSPLGRWKHRQLVRDGELEGHKVGKQFLVHRNVLNAYIERHGPGGRKAREASEG